MEDLIKALQIFAKYTDKKDPIYCNDEMLVVLVVPSEVADEDIEELKRLGFFANIENGEHFYSLRFGGC